MIHALKTSLENEDVLYAINMEVYKSLLTFLLRAFSFEKELIERESLQQQHPCCEPTQAGVSKALQPVRSSVFFSS